MKKPKYKCFLDLFVWLLSSIMDVLNGEVNYYINKLHEIYLCVVYIDAGSLLSKKIIEKKQFCPTEMHKFWAKYI